MKKHVNTGYKQERKLATRLGLTPIPFSGSRWQSRQDAECHHFLLQSKATGNKTISIRREDVDGLFADAAIARKIPVMALEMVTTVIDGPALSLLVIAEHDVERFCKAFLEGHIPEGDSDDKSSRRICGRT